MSSKDASAMGGEHNEKPVLVPRLRFPEFREAEEWKVRELGGLCRIRTGKKDANEGCENGLYPFFTCAERHIFSNTYSFDAEAILIAGNANVGQAKYYKGKFEAYQRTYVLTNFAQVSVPYLYLYLSSQLSEALARQVQTSAMSYIKLPMLETYKVPSPRAPAEQQKIADCLSSLDELITAETQKLDALKTHKKGLMQQLFPREGETAPRLRFPEFREAGEWEPKTIGNSCESFSGGTPSTTNKSFYGGQIPFIRSAEIDKDETELFLSNEGLKNSAAKMVKVGDILVALYGANSGDVALSKIDGAINQAILCLRHETNNRFVYQYLAHKKEWIIATFIQGGQGNLSGEIIKAIGLFFPRPNEQQRIADCLSSLDDLITAQSQKIDVLKTHKKGQMQQLFPVLDEAQA